MSSLSRKDYLRIFRFAKDVFLHTSITSRAALIPEACRIMDMVEDAIGQQADRPPRSRGYQVVKFGKLKNNP